MRCVCLLLSLVACAVAGVSEADYYNPNFYQIESQRIANVQYAAIKNSPHLLAAHKDVEYLELPTVAAAVGTVKNITLQDCDNVKGKLFALLDKIKVTSTAVKFANKLLHVSIKKPVPLTFSTELDEGRTCLPVNLKVDFDAPNVTIAVNKNLKVFFTGLWGKGTIDRKDNKTWIEMQIGWKTAVLTMFGKDFPFENDKFMSWTPDKVTMPLPGITIGKMTLSDLSVEWEKDPETWAFTGKSTWPFEMAVAGKFWTNASATNQSYSIDASSTVKALNLGGAIFGVKLDGLSISGHVDDKAASSLVQLGDAPNFNAAVSWTKGVVSVFGLHTEIPLASPMTVENNGIAIQLSSLDLGVVKLGATNLSLTRSPYQFTAAGSITTPHPIDFDCTFPLAACQEEGKKEGEANCTKPHPSIALSTKLKTMALGTADFGVKAEGIDLSGAYTNGLFKVAIHFSKLTAKIFGKEVVMNNGGFSYEKDKLVINIPEMVFSFITLPPGTLTITDKQIDFETTIAFRGKSLGFTAVYNRTSGDVSCALTTTGVVFSFEAKAGSFTFGSITLTPRSMAIEYAKETKALAFKAEANLVITLFSLKVTFDPVSLYLSAKKVTIAATITNFEIYGAKPKVQLDMSYEESTGCEAALKLEMTGSDVQKIVKGLFNANAKMIQKGCEFLSPIAIICQAVGKAVDFVGDMLSKLLSFAPAINLELNKAGIKLYLSIPIGDGLATLFPFAKFMKGVEMQLGTEVDFTQPKESIPGLFFKICKNGGKDTLWFFKASWVGLKINLGLGIRSLEFSLKTLPDVVASFSGTIQADIPHIMDFTKCDSWVLKLGGYFRKSALGAVSIGLSFEMIEPVLGAFGIRGFNLRYLKIAVEISPQSALILKSLEFQILSADFGPITGVSVAGKIDIVEVTNNYFFFGIDAVTVSKVIGAIIGKTITGWPSFLDFRLDKTSLYFAASPVQINLPGGVLDLKAGFAVKTGIRFLGFVVIIDAGVQLTGAKIPNFYIKQFKLDMTKMFDGIQALFDSIGDTVSKALNWKPLKTAISMAGKALLSFFPLRLINIEGLEVDPSKPMDIKLPSIELGFVFMGMATNIKIPGFGVQEGLKNFPTVFKAALRAFADCWGWIKKLVGKAWENVKALVGAAIKAVGAAIGAAIKFLGNAIKDFGKMIGNAAVAVGKAFVAAAKWVAGAAVAVGKAFVAAGKAVKAFFVGAGKVFGQVAGAIVNAFKNPAKTLKQVGEFFAKVINWSGMLNAGKAALKAVGDLAQKAFDGAKKLLDSVAKSKVGKAVVGVVSGGVKAVAKSSAGKAVASLFRFGRRRRLLNVQRARTVQARRRLTATTAESMGALDEEQGFFRRRPAPRHSPARHRPAPRHVFRAFRSSRPAPRHAPAPRHVFRAFRSSRPAPRHAPAPRHVFRAFRRVFRVPVAARPASTKVATPKFTVPKFRMPFANNKKPTPKRVVAATSAVVVTKRPTATPGPVEKNPAKVNGIAFKFTAGESFSRTQGVKDLYASFQNLDSDKDGKVTEAEIDAMDFIGGKSCKTLGWAVKIGTQSCGVSIAGKCADATFDVATETCDKLGARLCTSDEILKGVPTNAGMCQNTHIWSSTEAGCTNGEFKVRIQGSTTDVCRKTFSTRMDPANLFYEKEYARNPQGIPASGNQKFSKPAFSFSEMVVRACNSHAGCTEGTSCKQGLCVFPNGNHKMENVNDAYWMERRNARLSKRDLNPISTNDEDYYPVADLSELELSVQCAGGCPAGTICGERATCVFPPAGHPEFLEMENGDLEVDHDPVGQIRCCSDASPISGDDKSMRDQYWGGANIITADNSLSFPEMVIWAMGGSKGLDFASVKIFLTDAKLILDNPEWEPHYKGYKLFRQFHPVEGHLKEIKGTTPAKCEQECTNSPGVGLCEGFVVLQDTCWLKTSAFTTVTTGDAAAGSYYFQKNFEELDSNYDRKDGANKVPVSAIYYSRNQVVSATKCAAMCTTPTKGVCVGYLIDSRGLCHLASFADRTSAAVVREGFNFFFKVAQKGPSLPGYKKNYNTAMTGSDLQAYGRRTPEECSTLCDHSQWGICAAFEINAKGECHLKSTGGMTSAGKHGYTLYVKNSLATSVKELADGHFAVAASELKGTVFYSGKITAKNCRKACTSVPIFIGDQRVLSSATASLVCQGFDILADGTCRLFSRITGQTKSTSVWSFNNNNKKVLSKWSFDVIKESAKVCLTHRADFVKEAKADLQNGPSILDAAVAACAAKDAAAATNLASATSIAAGLCTAFKQKFIDAAKELGSTADMKAQRVKAAEACAKQDENDTYEYCKKYEASVCVKNRGSWLDDCKKQTTPSAAASRLAAWKKVGC